MKIAITNKKFFGIRKFINTKTTLTSILVAIIVSVLTSVICLEIKPGVHKYCREKDKVIDAEEVDDYLLVEAEINSSVILECRFCEDQNKKEAPKIWYWQDPDQSSEIREVELDMDNNASLSRVHVTSENSLIIRIFRENDTGIYRCLGKNESQEEGLYNYRIERIAALKLNNSDVRGDLAAYNKFKKANLDSLNKDFAESDIDEFVGIREAGITLEVVTEWGVWSPCEECVKKRGLKKKRGHCRLKRYYNESTTSDSEILQMFKNNPIISCKSRFLQELFPSVSNATRHLPEFILTEKCKPCKREKKKKKHKFKYKKRYLLAQGGHLTLSCPNTTILSDIIWMKDSKVLPRGKGRSVRKKDSTPRIYVDHYNTIYLKDVSDPEQGKYTCTVDEKRILQATVVVVPKRGLLTEAFVMHLRILGFIFLLTTVLYCAGVIRACRHRDQFRIKTYEQLKEEREIFADSHKS